MGSIRQSGPEPVLSRRLEKIVLGSPIASVLPKIAELGLPDWWLAGGAVRNTVWKALFGSGCSLVIKDYDIAFYNQTGDRQEELDAKQRLQARFPDETFDVKNQASFGVWRKGWKIFSSSQDGISNWLHTATATGVRLNASGHLEIFAPYGLSDLFAGILRPTPSLASTDAADAKAAQLKSLCPQLILAQSIEVL